MAEAVTVSNDELATVRDAALRRHADGSMDDVVIPNVEMFHAEQMSDGHLWMACYFANGERVTFGVDARRKNDLVYDVGEMPERWVDIDAERRSA